MRLTDQGIKVLQPPQKGQKTYFCDTLKGFGLRVSQGGSRSFILQHGADRQLTTIGRYPVISLAQAREEARRILAERTLGKHRPRSIPFEEAKKIFLLACERKNKPRTVYDYTRILKRHFPFGRKQLSDISTTDIQRRLDKITSDSERAYASRVAKLFFTWAYKRAYIDTSPASRLDIPQSTPRSRVLTDTELQLIWRACECTPRQSGLSLPHHFATIVQLLILTAQRRGEVAALRTDYFKDDTCTLPSNLTKNGREHTFPIGSLSLSLLSPHLTTTSTGILFPARGKTAKPFNGWSKAKAQLDQLSGVNGYTLHDIRRTVATRLAEMGTAPHIVERLLNHATGSLSAIARVYNKAAYLQEMRAAVVSWEKHLQTVLKLG